MPCAGKSTVARLLRDRGVNVIDMDDEILRLNGGQWPETIEIKENVLQPKMLDAVSEMPSVVLLNSYMQVERTRALRTAGFRTVLLRVSDRELQRRDRQREAQEGWSNREWSDWHRRNLDDLRNADLIDAEVSGEQEPALVADSIIAEGSATSTAPGSN